MELKNVEMKIYVKIQNCGIRKMFYLDVSLAVEIYKISAVVVGCGEG